MKLYQYTFIETSYTDTGFIVAKNELEAQDIANEKANDEYLSVIVQEVEVDGYNLQISISPHGVEYLETDGWIIKVGQVYSSPYEPVHLRVDKITLSDNGDSDDAMIHGTWVDPNDHSKEVVNIESDEDTTSFRAWHLNEAFGLEMEVE